MFRFWLFLLAFLEGVLVMSLEILASSFLKPFFGSSLSIWSVILSCTLMGLALGYLLGGKNRLSTKSKFFVDWLFVVFGIWMLILPVFYTRSISSMLELTPLLAVFFCSIFTLIIPLVLIGSTIPLLVDQSSSSLETSGSITGKFFTLSSIGGICSALIIGFYILPKLGTTLTTQAFGILASSVGIIGFVKNKKYWIFVIVPLILLPVKYSRPKGSATTITSVASKDGILGKINVVEQNYPSQYRGIQKARTLLVNNIEQTSILVDNSMYSAYDYAYFFPTAASIYPPGSKSLLLGLGGGTITKQFSRLGFEQTVCEFDERIKEVAIDLFFVDPKTNIVIDDARHFCESTTEHFDVVCYDLYHSEMLPYHLLTSEAFHTVKNILNDQGLLIINFFGHIEGTKGLAARSVLKTLLSSGFQVQLFVTPNDPASRNLIFLASTRELDFSKVNYSEPGLPALSSIEPYFLNLSEIDLSDAVVLADDKPIFPKIYEPAAIPFKQAQTEYYLNRLIKNGISPY